MFHFHFFINAVNLEFKTDANGFVSIKNFLHKNINSRINKINNEIEGNNIFMLTKRKLCVLFKKEIKDDENSDFYVYTIDKKLKYFYSFQDLPTIKKTILDFEPAFSSIYVNDDNINLNDDLSIFKNNLFGLSEHKTLVNSNIYIVRLYLHRSKFNTTNKKIIELNCNKHEHYIKNYFKQSGDF